MGVFLPHLVVHGMWQISRGGEEILERWSERLWPAKVAPEPRCYSNNILRKPKFWKQTACLMLMPDLTKGENKSPCLSSWVTQGHTWQGCAAGAKTWECTELGNMWAWVMKEDANLWAYFFFLISYFFGIQYNHQNFLLPSHKRGQTSLSVLVPVNFSVFISLETQGLLKAGIF